VSEGYVEAQTSGRSRAEAALLRAQAELAECLGQDIVRLEAFRAEMGAAPGAEQVAQFYMRAHDLKSLGGSSGFPLVTVIASQLCQLIDDERYGFAGHAGFIDDHIDALKAVYRRKLRTPEHPAGRQILAELRQDLDFA
jgi:hypothetical protein